MERNITSDLVSWEYAPDASIEYPPAILEELRRLAVEGLVAFGHGGLETGGVLYGGRDGNKFRILASANLECEHAFGPGFVLSGNDRSALARLLQAPAGYEAIGWYRTCTRHALGIDKDDLVVFGQFFAAKRSVMLALKPTPWGPCSAAFFVREADGKIVPSKQEFSIKPVELRTSGPGEADPQPQTEPKEKVWPPLTPFPDVPSPVNARFRHWGWLAAVVGLLLILAISAFAVYHRPHHSRQLALRAFAISPSLVRIEWDRNSVPVADGVSGSLQILDGDSVKTIPLDTDQLRQSSVIYSQQSREIMVSLRVEPRGPATATAEESIVFSEGAEQAVAPEVADALRQSIISNGSRTDAAAPAPPAGLQPPINPVEQSPPGPPTVEQQAVGKSSAEEPPIAAPPERGASVRPPKKFQPSFPSPKKGPALIPLLPAAPPAQAGSVQPPLPDMPPGVHSNSYYSELRSSAEKSLIKPSPLVGTWRWKTYLPISACCEVNFLELQISSNEGVLHGHLVGRFRVRPDMARVASFRPPPTLNPDLEFAGKPPAGGKIAFPFRTSSYAGEIDLTPAGEQLVVLVKIGREDVFNEGLDRVKE
jgi:hypothetical protein